MKGKKGPVPDSEKKPNGKALKVESVETLKCEGCTFHTHDLGEMTEHLSGTKHAGFSTDFLPDQADKEPELFSDPQVVLRHLEVKLTFEEVAEINMRAATIAMDIVEQHGIIENAKARLKAREKDQASLVATLRSPVKIDEVRCEWQFNVGDNSKKLIRLDTGETVETRALSAEDRMRELANIQAQNENEAKEAV